MPKPFFLFLYLTIIVMIISMILHFSLPNGVILHDVYDKSKKAKGDVTIQFYNFFSAEGIIWWFENIITNFTGLSTVGIVLFTVLCITVAEKSGFIDVSLKKLATSTPKKLLTPILIMIGAISSIASDAGYLILVPLAGVLFQKANRHPLIGVVAMFAGVSAGFAANLVPATSEAIMTSATNDFLGYKALNLLSNWYFTLLLIPVYTLVGWFVTEKIIAKRIESRYKAKAIDEVNLEFNSSIKFNLQPNEKKAMWFVLGFVILYLTGVLLMMFIPYAPFNAPFNKDFRSDLGSEANILKYNVLTYMVVLIAFMFLGIGIVYGYVSRNFKTQKDFIDTLIYGFKRSASTLLIFLIMAQFIKALGKTRIDMVAAYYLGYGIAGLPTILTILLFILIVAFINLFMGSMSAKWFILGPIFAISLQNVGIHPATTVMAYRVGDSATNVISPLMTYFPIVLLYAQEWIAEEEKEQFQTGSLMSLMFPYSMMFLLTSTIVFLIWFALGIPVGVDGPIHINLDTFKSEAKIKTMCILSLNNVKPYFINLN